jgi:hypothetical protein
MKDGLLESSGHRRWCHDSLHTLLTALVSDSSIINNAAPRIEQALTELYSKIELIYQDLGIGESTTTKRDLEDIIAGLGSLRLESSIVASTIPKVNGKLLNVQSRLELISVNLEKSDGTMKDIMDITSITQRRVGIPTEEYATVFLGIAKIGEDVITEISNFSNAQTQVKQELESTTSKLSELQVLLGTSTAPTVTILGTLLDVKDNIGTAAQKPDSIGSVVSRIEAQFNGSEIGTLANKVEAVKLRHVTFLETVEKAHLDVELVKGFLRNLDSKLAPLAKTTEIQTFISAIHMNLLNRLQSHINGTKQETNQLLASTNSHLNNIEKYWGSVQTGMVDLNRSYGDNRLIMDHDLQAIFAILSSGISIHDIRRENHTLLSRIATAFATKADFEEMMGVFQNETIASEDTIVKSFNSKMSEIRSMVCSSYSLNMSAYNKLRLRQREELTLQKERHIEVTEFLRDVGMAPKCFPH